MSVKPWMRVSSALLAVAWGGNEFTPLLVMYRTVEGYEQVAVDMLLAAYVLGIVPALLVGGPLSDRHGRRALMIPAPILAMVGSILLALGAGSLVLLFVGRVFSGLALGLGMAVGTSWIKELSDRPYEEHPERVSGARRASLSLTAGFALGAVIAATLAQFAPLQTVLPYVINLLICLPAVLLVAGAPETRHASAPHGSLLSDLKIPATRQHRFWFVVAPSAPWVFGCAASSYAILPALMADVVGPDYGIAFSGLMCLVGLGCGFFIQPLGRHLDRDGSIRSLAVGMVAVILGMLTAVAAAATLNIVVVLAASAVLGCGYGLVLVSGLQEVQRIARPDDLAGLTAVFYSLTYVGFFVPMVLALIARFTSYPWLFASGAVIAALCLGVMAYGRRHEVRDLDALEAAAAR
ncbi:MFS transporter [Kocuria marina]|uniref:Major Facilitator Superfamily protein n=1 Tax=Kocuria marina subsp. indica TaxID=1049583 RepID=A0A1X7CRI1_9MICC|nr:MFS transporter [Kocuria indica]OXS84125.1 MFS transporter [Kocuria indica]RLP58422.1 MFS transporter [Kocuria indica]SMF01286.1 Major Facilitator Superfamily protein [Kocuria indica]